MVAAPVDALFAGSDGRYYTAWQLRRRLRSDAWELCVRTPDRLLVETGGARLVLLTRIDPAALPSWTEIRVEAGTARVVDTRQPVPPAARDRRPVADGDPAGRGGTGGASTDR